MRKRFLAQALALVLCSVLLFGCSKPADENPLMTYLGDYSYSDSAICMVYERIEGEKDEEGNPLYGIQYRKINDLNGLLASGSTILIYFYSSMDNGSALITASVEEMASEYNGQMTVVMLDAMQYRALVEKYDIEAVPEFILKKDGESDKVFGAFKYDYWTVGDVVYWLNENGIK